MGGDFNGHVEYASSSTAPGQGTHMGQNRGGKLMVKLAAETKLSICTGKIVGDLDMPCSITERKRFG
eukprot:jgi/Botrbrau1/12875/Bobra.0188s0017.1